MIQTTGLTKQFRRSIFSRRKITALNGIDLEITQGELCVLLGPNGAGKTTLVKILTTLVLPCSGSALVGGYDVVKNHKKVRKLVGLVADGEKSFYWRLTGRQNLKFFAALNNLGAGVDRKIRRLAELLDMSADLDRAVKDYSAGMRQKLSFIRGLLHDPDIILMDEPFRNLDPATKQHLAGFILDELIAQMKKTVFLTTHNLHEAEELGTRIAIMVRGRIVKTGSLQELKAFRGPNRTYAVTFFLPSGGNFHTKYETANVHRYNVYDFIDKIRAGGGEIITLQQQSPTLYQIYRKYTEAGIE